MGPEARVAYEAGLRGEHEVLVDWLERVRDEPSGPLDAWRAALAAMCWFGSPRAAVARDPRSIELGRFVAAPAGEREGAALAAALRVRAHVIAFDGAGLDAACGLFEQLVGGLGPGEARDRFEVALAWRALARGGASPDLEDLVRRAIRDGRADLVIEAVTVRALAATAAGDLAGALRLARRVSRMARTEAMPQLEILAHLVLARLRRLTGKPHLGTRILSALFRVAPPPWRPWLEWELVLARGEGASVGEAALELEALLVAARGGDRPAFDRTGAALAARAASFAPVSSDLGLLWAALDPGVPAAATPPALEPFCRGAVDEPPLGLVGVAGGRDEEAPVAWVLSRPGVAPRRLLAPGDGLARAAGPVRTLQESEGRQLRTDSAIAVLALAGPDGIDEGSLFRRLYGFEYEPVRHQSVRAVLYGRVRKRLGDAAELERQEGRLRLVHEEALLVPDPRCSPPPETRILRVLAERREAPAREVAERLGIPLRTVQEALRRLADDGALRAERRAHGLHYVLEDTTFSEPTRRGRL
jgi:DNA-binding transcriptional ArsR family regulator